MGTIVINQTDCKQNVVLESSLDGIIGGYYDASGVWHDLGAEPEYQKGFFFHWGNSYSTDGQGGTLGFDDTANNTRSFYAATGGEHAPEMTITNGIPPVYPYFLPLGSTTKVKVTRDSGSTDYYASLTTLSYENGAWIRKNSSGFIQIGSSVVIPIASGSGTHAIISIKIGSAGTTSFNNLTPPLSFVLE